MGSKDKRLGMDRSISRRDFINGVSVAIGASLLPACAREDTQPLPISMSSYYPPAATGMRGSHPGSFEIAHAAVQGSKWEAEESGEKYDLVVVGAGLSGLSAAYLYRRDVDPNARILVLDNHDDFGGHAKRNEFTLDGETYIGFGGTMLIESPKTYPAVSAQLIRELGIDTDRNSEFVHYEELESMGLERGTFFDKETFGADFLTTGDQGLADGLSDAPLSDSAKGELKRLFANEKNYLPDMEPKERRAVLEAHSYREYLETFAGIGDEVLTFVQKLPHGVWAIGADALPAWMAYLQGYPGFADMDVGFGDEGKDDMERFRFPDGNATIARLLVRKIVPGSAPGDSMDDIVTARFDYSSLDKPDNGTRIRLQSTVVDLRHRDGDLNADVDVSYVNDGNARSVRASKVVWAGYHSMLPYVCPDLPEEQISAQKQLVRAPLVYTSVLIRDWTSLAKLGVNRSYCPGSFFQAVSLSHPVSIGEHRFSTSPEDPVVLHLQHIPLSPGLPAAEQFREGRRALLETSFETFERNVRDQLSRMYGPGGFDSARDIAGITVNRWPHGYAYSTDAESGDVSWWPEVWPYEKRPWVESRQAVGNITFAGIDASSNAMTESAIEEAHRAVSALAADRDI